jgi:hypothetical protein
MSIMDIYEFEKCCEECNGKGWYSGYNPNSETGFPETACECEHCDGEGTVGKYKGKIVCIDFDGVMAEYKKWKGIDHQGEPLCGIYNLIEQLIDGEAEVWVFTTRLNEYVNKGHTIQELRHYIAKWLNENRFPEEIQIWDMPGKPIADLYIDDRAHYHKTNDQWYQDEINEVLKRLEEGD